MKITLQTQILPDADQAKALKETDRDPCEECGRPVLFRGEILCPMCFELNCYIDGSEDWGK